MFNGNNFDGTDDIMDTRDIQARIDELESIEVIDRDEDEQDELDALYALKEETEYYFSNEESFISDDYFEEYAEELCKDCGMIPEDLPSWIHIDWERTAAELQQDYTSYEFRGTTYWIR